MGKSLTLNLGLAYAMVTPISEAHDRIADFDPANGQFLIAGQNAGSTAGVKMDWTALEPRVGAAWKPFGNSTVFRGGYAIFHDSSWNQGAQGLWQNPPYYAETHQPFGTPMSAGFVDLTSPLIRRISKAPSGRNPRISSKAEFSSLMLMSSNKSLETSY